MASELVASSDEAAWSSYPDPVDYLALDPVAWIDSDCEEWADWEPEAEPEADADPDIGPSELEAAPVGDPISVCSSSDWETVTTSGSTFRGVPLVPRGAVRKVVGLRGTYVGSVSMSVSSSIDQKLGATDLDLPRFE